MFSPFAVKGRLLTLSAMQARQSHENGVQVIALAGELDMACSPELRELLHEQASSKQPALVLDFSEISYIDSSGLATLVEYVRLAQDFGGKFGLAAVTERVRTILDLVRLSEIFPIFPTLAEAKAAFAPPRSAA